MLVAKSTMITVNKRIDDSYQEQKKMLTKRVVSKLYRRLRLDTILYRHINIPSLNCMKLEKYIFLAIEKRNS